MIVEGLIAAYFAEQMLGKREQPMGTTAVGNHVVTVMNKRKYLNSWYELHVASEGQTAMVAREKDYEALVAHMTRWDSYLESGGTIGVWLAAKQDRHVEVQALEKLL